MCTVMFQLSDFVLCRMPWNVRVSEPEADTRKKDAFTYMMVLGFTALVTGYYKRFKWATFKTRAITYVK
jgi:uncharacterized membrane protein